MDKMTKVLLVFLCVCLLACAIPAMAANETSGKCGENVTWTFDEATHTLIISGTGAMNNDPFGREMRWRHLYEQIFHIVVEDGITSICDYAFEGSVKLQTVSIAQSVTSIGDWAFARTGLTHIDLHNGITHIGVQAFEESHLKEVRIPAGVTALSGGIFRGSERLTDVVLHDGITTIGSNAFSDCTALQSIVIPDSVTFMDGGFSNCTALKEITLSCNTRYISTACFRDCTSLEEIHLPDSVEIVGNWAFQNCTALRVVTLGSGISEIEYTAFKGCANLTRVEVREKNPWLCNDAYGAVYSKDRTQLLFLPTGLTGEYTVAEGTQTIHHRAGRECIALTGLVLPDSVTTIGPYAFDGCVALKQLDLGKVQKIDSEAFNGCKALEILTVPASVTHVDSGAFSGCEGLRVVEFLGDRPVFGHSVFSMVKADVWYPAGNATWENDFPEDAYYLTWHPGCAGAHTLVHEEAVAPTCTAAGKQASAYCMACGFVAAYPTRIPAIAHSFGPWQHASPAGTPFGEWKVARTCENCGFEEKRLASQLDPSQLPEGVPDETDPETEPTIAQTTTPETRPTTDDVIEPADLNGVSIVILVIAVVAACFVGVEVYLTQKKKKAE